MAEGQTKQTLNAPLPFYGGGIKTVHYCLVICRVSSTGHIYHRAAKRRGDKFDQSMTRGKLLDNDTQLFIFISILIMTQLHPRDPENRQQNRFSEWEMDGNGNGKAWLGLLPVRIYLEIMPSSCPLTS